MIDKLRCTAYGILLTLALSVVNRGVFGQALVSAEDTTAAVQDTPKAGGEESAVGSGMAAIAGRPRQQALSDLTIGNFFAAGWDEDFAMRKRETGTLDLPLLRVQSNEMLRLFRTNYYYQNDLNSATKKVLADVDGFIDVALDRRIMVEVNGVYQWSYPTSGLATSGGAPGFLTRIQLVDTESSSLCANFKVVTNPALGTYDSTVSYGLAGFQDLAYWLNLDRVGLYYSLSFDSLAGPAAAGTAQRRAMGHLRGQVLHRRRCPGLPQVHGVRGEFRADGSGRPYDRPNLLHDDSRFPFRLRHQRKQQEGD